MVLSHWRIVMKMLSRIKKVDVNNGSVGMACSACITIYVMWELLCLVVSFL